MKHVHCEVIKEWADGAEIQYLYATNEWRDAGKNPTWSASAIYRVKPPKKQLWARPYKYVGADRAIDCVRAESQEKLIIHEQHGREWAGPAVLVWEGE
jgi:hypothetical protein